MTAVIPARNEAAMLPAALPTLLGQDYPGTLTVILVDDCSSDGTAEVAGELARTVSRPGRALRVVAGAPLPDGWAGKVWAMSQGLAAAGAGGARPAYVLFTDADIAWQRGALRDLVSAADTDDRDLVSQMALLRTATRWERVVVPAFVYFFAQLYPFARVNSPAVAHGRGGRRLHAGTPRGAGAVRRAGRRSAAPASTTWPSGRVIKRQRGRCWLGLSTRGAERAALPAAGHLWQMVARSAYTQLGYSPWLLAGTIAGLLFALCRCRRPGRSSGWRPAGAAPRFPPRLAAGAGLAGLGADVAELPAHAAAVPAVAAARARPAADRLAVRRDDCRLRPAPLPRPRRGMAQGRNRTLPPVRASGDDGA